jgi:hypothetical protein
MKNSNVPPNSVAASLGGPQLVRKPAAMARPRPVVQLLETTKRSIHRDWSRGVPEKDLAKIYEIRREEVELVLYEMTWSLVDGGRAA